MKQREFLPRRNTVDGRGPGNLFRGWRAVIRGTARLATAISSVWLLFVFVCSANSDYDTEHNLPRPHTPGTCLLIALIFWAVTSDSFLRIARVEWRSWSVGRWTVFALLAANMLLAFRNAIYCPEHAVLSYLQTQENLADRMNQRPNEMESSIDNFAARCRRELPPDARILFHGSLEGSVFAYEVYPRKVFRLPSEYFRLGTILQSRSSAKGFPWDPVEAYWHHVVPPQADERDNFIRAHGISHEVYFEVDRSAECRWEQIR